MKVIQHIDDSETTIVARWPQRGTAGLELGRQVQVGEDQEVFLCRDGVALDAFGAGLHTLTAGNLPVLVGLEGRTPASGEAVQAVVVFVSSRSFPDLKWGTREPMEYRDPELGDLPLRGFGRFGIRVTEPRRFVDTVVGPLGLGTTDALQTHLRKAIVGRLTDALNELLPSIRDLSGLQEEITSDVTARVSADFAAHGVELVGLDVGGISPPRGAKKLLKRRS